MASRNSPTKIAETGKPVSVAPAPAAAPVVASGPVVAPAPAPIVQRDGVPSADPREPVDPVPAEPVGVRQDTAVLVEQPVVMTEELRTSAEAVAEARGPVIPVERPGPGVGAEHVAEQVVTVQTRPIEQVAAPRVPSALVAAPAVVIDPSAVPGERTLLVLAPVLKDGRRYEIGEEITLDFRSYSELVTIGAVPPTTWGR